ncbi:metallophosphoesterase family protein [soil metagenome]
MRIGLIGDIHADIRALEATLRHLDRLDVGQILCDGDLVGYGSQPDAVVDLVHARAIPCIMGNHDRWALERRQVIGMRGWKPAKLKDETWEYLEALPASCRWTAEGRTLMIHHGSPASDTEFVTPYKPLPPSIDQFWAETDVEILVLGHTHLPMIVRNPGQLLINPGSVMGVPGVQTSYSFGIVDLDDQAVMIHEVRTGREIRRDPVFLNGG